ncbi:MAG: DNA gyrase inhibitor YacG [Paracoccaceae bacterium]|nr:DNA gyrase inhibitor YacG [Paracoccaceae bacterium]
MSRCPVCDTATARDWRPFCSKRCADIDLGRWMTGAYAVPGEPADEDDIAPDTDMPRR